METVLPVLLTEVLGRASDEDDRLAELKPLMLTFTEAQSHIPKHRRLIIFKCLINELGPERFLGPMILLLCKSYLASLPKLTLSEFKETARLPLALLASYDLSACLTVCQIYNIFCAELMCCRHLRIY